MKRPDFRITLPRVGAYVWRAFMRGVHRLLLRRNRVLIVTMLHLGRQRVIDVTTPSGVSEYVRLSSFELCVTELHARNVPGAIAELGVYQGDFAVVMNRVMPGRRLYLFDTFEGFDAVQEADDRTRRGLRFRRDFSDTSVESVLARMPHPAACVVRQGIFPASTAGLDELFAFVSIDADLYGPVLAGLEYFYPRLEAGGYIFVHDYNNSQFPGAHAAVLEFSRTHSAPYVPLTDAYGTAVFAK